MRLKDRLVRMSVHANDGTPDDMFGHHDGRFLLAPFSTRSVSHASAQCQPPGVASARSSAGKTIAGA